jgi:hypothetical protein
MLREQELIHPELPPGTVVQSCSRLGKSEWTVVARIEANLASGEPKSYFLKVMMVAEADIPPNSILTTLSAPNMAKDERC